MAREKDPNSRLASGFENLKHLSVICWPFSICFTIPTCMSYTTKTNRARPHGLLVAAGCTPVDKQLGSYPLDEQSRNR